MSALMLAAVLAATPITLEDARAKSRGNVQALTAVLEVSSAEQDVRVARSGLLPQINFRGGANYNYTSPQRTYELVPVRDPEGEPIPGAFERQVGRSPEFWNPSFNLALTVSQLVYDRAIWARLSQSGAQLEAERGEALEQADTSELEGIQRFFALYRTQSTIEVLKANVARSEQQLERARALFQAGRVGKAEELSAQVNLGNDRITVVLRQAQLARDQAQLATWLAMPGTEALEAVTPPGLDTPPAPPPSLEQSVAEARDRRPLLRALRQRIRVAELQRSIATAGYLPRVSVQGSLQRGGFEPDVFFGEPSLQNSASAGLSFQWDLFNGFSTQAQTRRAEYQTRIAELNFRQSERELEALVRQSHEILLSQISASELAEANRRAAADALRLAEERFNAGV
ncbi:MAG TPA: TolC family protein, partial [Archangium sp.]